MEDDNDEFWTDERRMRIREMLERENIRHDQLRFHVIPGELELSLQRNPSRRRTVLFCLVLFVVASLVIGSLCLFLDW
ncbi:hypothetical protein JQ615_35830 [Bradyrhizobium jicamae]|uniref:DUF3040 domain-containing protein n=1 Tax=Bradyrhizobium jicamae TaxID=280332 RepID=A0ABS5FVD6_9BRAD|nr:hypothetical protein [Bradyrhizobium jicamae]MBR0800745.1 hypothetical protein [Bradyrhizobium jicamae]MBR0934326.1 hypothetical protein [Bradyrhizobium jicamae]